MECVPCGKTFTGYVCYEQHLESEKHKRKVQSHNILIGQGSAASALQGNTLTMDPKFKGFQCNVCNIAFNSLEIFQHHVSTREHAEKVISKNLNSNETVSSSDSPTEDLDNAINENKCGNESVSNEDQEIKAQLSSFQFGSSLNCEPCKKIFSGPESYIQHMKSEVHRKKMQHLYFLKKYTSEMDSPQKINDLKTEENNTKMHSNPWFCKDCNVQCSGPIPYETHLTGASHIKKTKLYSLPLGHSPQSVMHSDGSYATISSGSNQQNEALKTGENSMKIDSSNPWFCKICNVQCSGNVPYEMHLVGAAHVKKMKLYNDLLGNSQQSAMHLHNAGSYAANSSQLVNGIYQQDEIDGDSLIPGFSEKLKVMSTEELGISIKVILPDEKVDFDKQENKANEDVENGVPVKEESTEKQVGAVDSTTGPYKICELCNVELFNADDVVKHYESQEHYAKRWQSN